MGNQRYSDNLGRQAVATLLELVGFRNAHCTAVATLSDVLSNYVTRIGICAKARSDASLRVESNIFDIATALKEDFDVSTVDISNFFYDNASMLTSVAVEHQICFPAPHAPALHHRITAMENITDPGVGSADTESSAEVLPAYLPAYPTVNEQHPPVMRESEPVMMVSMVEGTKSLSWRPGSSNLKLRFRLGSGSDEAIASATAETDEHNEDLLQSLEGAIQEATAGKENDDESEPETSIPITSRSAFDMPDLGFGGSAWSSRAPTPSLFSPDGRSLGMSPPPVGKGSGASPSVMSPPVALAPQGVAEMSPSVAPTLAESPPASKGETTTTLVSQSTAQLPMVPAPTISSNKRKFEPAISDGSHTGKLKKKKEKKEKKEKHKHKERDRDKDKETCKANVSNTQPKVSSAASLVGATKLKIKTFGHSNKTPVVAPMPFGFFGHPTKAAPTVYTKITDPYHNRRVKVRWEGEEGDDEPYRWYTGTIVFLPAAKRWQVVYDPKPGSIPTDDKAEVEDVADIEAELRKTDEFILLD